MVGSSVGGIDRSAVGIRVGLLVRGFIGSSVGRFMDVSVGVSFCGRRSQWFSRQ